MFNHQGMLTHFQNGIPSKGKILTLLSAKWFDVLSSRIPGLKHHFLHLGPPSTPGLVTADEATMLLGRSMTVRYVLEGSLQPRPVLICNQQPPEDLSR